MKRQVREYHRWEQGSSGSSNPALTEYNSENAQVYDKGTLGPRPGWKELTTSAGTRVHDPTTDTLKGLLWYQETDADERLALVFDDAGTPKFDVLPLDTLTWTAGQTLTNVAPIGQLYPAVFDDTDKILCYFDGSIMSAFGPHLLVATSSGPGTVPTVTTADGDARAVTINRERAYYWGIAATPGRIYYSNPADYQTIGATQSFDINADKNSYAGAPVGAWSVKNSLLIACKDGTWKVLTGASPENGSLKELGRDPVPVHGSAVVVDNQVFFLSPTGQGVIVATPGFVEAGQLSYLSPLAYPGSSLQRPNNSFMPLSAVGDDVNGFLFLPGRQLGDAADILAVERTNRVFNLSRWSMATAAQDIVFSRGRPNVLFAAADLGSTWHIYCRDHTLNRPAKSSDTKSVSLANEANTSSGSSVVVDLGEVVASPGTVCRPVKVVIDLDYWKGGDYSDPSLLIDATVLGSEATTPEDTMTQQTVSTTSWADTVGDDPYQRRVAVALPNLQFGTRFRVRLTFDNLALDAVQVYYDEQEDPR